LLPIILTVAAKQNNKPKQGQIWQLQWGKVLYLGSVFGFHFSVWTGSKIVKFKMLCNAAGISGNWDIFFISTLLYMYGNWWHLKRIRYSDSRYNIWLYLGTQFKKRVKWRVNL
jgi:hypothetical protein